MREISFYGIHLGVPIGWIAARVAEGHYQEALFDIGMVSVMVMIVLAIRRLVPDLRS